MMHYVDPTEKEKQASSTRFNEKVSDSGMIGEESYTELSDADGELGAIWGGWTPTDSGSLPTNFVFPSLIPSLPTNFVFPDPSNLKRFLPSLDESIRKDLEMEKKRSELEKEFEKNILILGELIKEFKKNIIKDILKQPGLNNVFFSLGGDYGWRGGRDALGALEALESEEKKERRKGE
jgi:hypothetical protein